MDEIKYPNNEVSFLDSSTAPPFIIGRIALKERKRLSDLNLTSMLYPKRDLRIRGRRSLAISLEDNCVIGVLDYHLDAYETGIIIKDIYLVGGFIEDTSCYGEVVDMFLGYLKFKNPTCRGIFFSIPGYQRDDEIINKIHRL